MPFSEDSWNVAGVGCWNGEQFAPAIGAWKPQVEVSECGSFSKFFTFSEKLIEGFVEAPKMPTQLFLEQGLIHSYSYNVLVLMALVIVME